MLHSNRRAWLAVTAMFVLNGALFGMWASRIPAIAARHGLDKGALGLLLLFLAVGAILSFPLAGRWSDRFGAARVTRRIAMLYTLALLPLALAPGPVTLALALFAFGATHGAMDVAMNTWAGEVERHIGRPVMSSFHAMFSLGAGLGAASGFVAARAGMGTAPHFVIGGALVAVATLWIARIDWPSPTRARAKGDPVFAFPRGPLLLVGAFAFCASLGEGSMTDWSAVFLVDVTRASEADAALGYVAFSVAMVVMRLLGDRVTKRFGPVTTARLAGITAAIGVLMVVGPGTYPAALLGFALMGIGYAVIVPLAFSRATNDPHLSPGVAIASVSTLGYGGFLVGPPLIGFVAEASSIRAAFVILLVLSALIVVLAKAVGPVRNRPR